MRYSTRKLLEIVAFAALLCMMLFALPDTAAFWSLMFTTLAVPSLAIPVIVYSRNNVRAFAIGIISSFALTPFAFFFFPFAGIIGGPLELIGNPSPGSPAEVRAWKIFFTMMLSSGVLIGLASVAIRHVCLKEQSKDGTPFDC